MKLYKVDFEGMWPVGNCLVILAENVREARDIAEDNVTHTKIKEIKEVKMDKSQVVVYLSGDY